MQDSLRRVGRRRGFACKRRRRARGIWRDVFGAPAIERHRQAICRRDRVRGASGAHGRERSNLSRTDGPETKPRHRNQDRHKDRHQDREDQDRDKRQAVVASQRWGPVSGCWDTPFGFGERRACRDREVVARPPHTQRGPVRGAAAGIGGVLAHGFERRCSPKRADRLTRRHACADLT